MSYHSAFPIFSGNHSLIIPTQDTLLIPQSPSSISSIDTTLLFPPLSPATSDTTSSSTAPSSPNISDNEDLDISMDQLSSVKKLLRMFPPPMTAEQFILRNSFKASDGHIKRPSNNFILFRKIAHDQKGQTPALSDFNERQFSQIIGRIWKGLTQEEISTYKRLGKDVAEMHKKMYPEYKYQPKRDKAAWKHFNPDSNISNPKSKRKNNKVRQQKDQETISDIPKINVNIFQQQQQQQQQQQIVPESTLEYTIPVPVELEQMDQIYYQAPYTTSNTYPTNNTYPTSNTYTANNPIMELFSEDYNNSMWMQSI